MKFFQRINFIFNQIPFVNGQNHGASFAPNQITQSEILVFDGDRPINQHHNTFSKFNSAEPIRNRKLFELFFDLAFAPDARRVPQRDVAPTPVPSRRDGITGDASFWAS